MFPWVCSIPLLDIFVACLHIWSTGDLPNPGIEPRSLVLQADSLPAEPQGKPKNIGVGSLTLLQRIFLTQESNQGLLHHRQMLYQLSYQRHPTYMGRASYNYFGAYKYIDYYEQ